MPFEHLVVAREPAVQVGKCRDGVEPERLEHRDRDEPGQRKCGRVLAEELGDVEVGDQKAETGEEGELSHADEAGEDPRRQARAVAGVERHISTGQRMAIGGSSPAVLHPAAAPRETGRLPALLAPGGNGGVPCELGDGGVCGHQR